MISSNELAGLAGAAMHGADGQKIGKIVDVYESTQAEDGTFVTVHTGMFGGHASFVPLAQASLQGKDVVVPYDKNLVKDAPRVQADQDLTSVEEDRLYQHYNLSPGGPAPEAEAAGAPGRHAEETAIPRGTKRQDSDGDGVFDDVKDTAVGRDTSGLTTDDAMTRSEERLQVGTQRVETGRARLRKRIVTEQVSTTVPVSHDEVVVEREPITEANMAKATDGPALWRRSTRSCSRLSGRWWPRRPSRWSGSSSAPRPSPSSSRSTRRSARSRSRPRTPLARSTRPANPAANHR